MRGCYSLPSASHPYLSSVVLQFLPSCNGVIIHVTFRCISSLSFTFPSTHTYACVYSHIQLCLCVWDIYYTHAPSLSLSLSMAVRWHAHSKGGDKRDEKTKCIISFLLSVISRWRRATFVKGITFVELLRYLNVCFLFSFFFFCRAFLFYSGGTSNVSLHFNYKYIPSWL